MVCSIEGEIVSLKRRCSPPQNLKWARAGRGKGTDAEMRRARNSAKFCGVVSELGYDEREEDGDEGKDKERGTKRSTSTDNCHYIAKFSWFSYRSVRTTLHLQ
jgi:hypothetical protein